MKKQKIKADINLKNNKAYFNYEIMEKFEAGIILIGSEIKSIMNHKVSFTDAYCLFDNDSTTSLLLKNFHIDVYESSSYDGHEPKRERILLLNKKELIHLNKQVKKQGITIIPLRLYIKNGWAKLEIGLAKGKNDQDKRATIKDKEWAIEKKRLMKYKY